jgi:uncharacterized NAD-dependent epimerase/dehydratase family protein
LEDAVVLAESVFGTTYGKTANGLVRFSRRYNVRYVIDSSHAGEDAGMVLNGKKCGIPVVSALPVDVDPPLSTLVVGVATDGGVLPPKYRKFIAEGLNSGLNIVSGLHEFLSDDPEFVRLATRNGRTITDVRKMFRDRKDMFTGRILEVKSNKIAVLGTDSAVGKRTTSVFLSESMKKKGNTSEMIGTGQTSWMQGFKYTIVLDAIINDFVSGALEAVTVEAWNDLHPDYMFLEGQGSVLHPAYPGSFEIIGALHPNAIILQHSPKRLYYDGFEQFKIPPLEKYIRILELLSDRKVIAVAINRDDMTNNEMLDFMDMVEKKHGIPAFDPLGNLDGITEYIQDTMGK